MQSSTQMASSKELQQHVGEKCYAPMKAWLREEEEENEVLRRVIKKLEEAVEEEETWTLCVLLAGLQLAAGFALAAAVLYASWHDPELCSRLLSLVPPEESCPSLAYELGKALLTASAGLGPP